MANPIPKKSKTNTLNKKNFPNLSPRQIAVLNAVLNGNVNKLKQLKLTTDDFSKVYDLAHNGFDIIVEDAYGSSELKLRKVSLYQFAVALDKTEVLAYLINLKPIEIKPLNMEVATVIFNDSLELNIKEEGFFYKGKHIKYRAHFLKKAEQLDYSNGIIRLRGDWVCDVSVLQLALRVAGFKTINLLLDKKVLITSPTFFDREMAYFGQNKLSSHNNNSKTNGAIKSIFQRLIPDWFYAIYIHNTEPGMTSRVVSFLEARLPTKNPLKMLSNFVTTTTFDLGLAITKKFGATEGLEYYKKTFNPQIVKVFHTLLTAAREDYLLFKAIKKAFSNNNSQKLQTLLSNFNYDFREKYGSPILYYFSSLSKGLPIQTPLQMQMLEHLVQNGLKKNKNFVTFQKRSDHITNTAFDFAFQDSEKINPLFGLVLMFIGVQPLAKHNSRMTGRIEQYSDNQNFNTNTIFKNGKQCLIFHMAQILNLNNVLKIIESEDGTAKNNLVKDLKTSKPISISQLWENRENPKQPFQLTQQWNTFDPSLKKLLGDLKHNYYFIRSLLECRNISTDFLSQAQQQTLRIFTLMNGPEPSLVFLLIHFINKPGKKYKKIRDSGRKYLPHDLRKMLFKDPVEKEPTEIEIEHNSGSSSESEGDSFSSN